MSAARVEDDVGLQQFLSVRRIDEQPERLLAPDRASRIRVRWRRAQRPFPWGRHRLQRREAAPGQSLRAIALQACTQWAIVPPPRITAATFTASAISSGLMPLSVHADVY